MQRFLVGGFLCFVLSLTGNVTARATTTRSQIKISEYVADLDRKGQLQPILEIANKKLNATIPDPILRGQMSSTLNEIVQTKDWSRLDHFPMVPMKMVNTMRPALGGLGGDSQSEKVVSQKFVGRLEDYLSGPCTEKAPHPQPVNKALPGVSNGHFPNFDLDKCFVHQSFRISKLLNSMLRNEGTEVTLDFKKINTPAKLFEALMDSGHHIEMRNERTYANFISLNAGKSPIIWPIWVETGFEDYYHQSIRIPVGHSQHAWVIKGPLVNTRIAFFLGIEGVGFFAQVDDRPAWTGMRAAYSVTNDGNGKLDILRALDVAAKYYQRIQSESQLYAKGMPADGYGYLGVCNDSNAVLEAATRMDYQKHRASITTYPLMRAADLDKKPRANDGLDDLIKSLPKDTEMNAGRQSVLERIWGMFPYENTDAPAIFDETLRKQMKTIQYEVQSFF